MQAKEERRESLKRSALGTGVAVVAMGLLAVACRASAQLVDVPPTWGGDLADRPRLTGNWDGFRDKMGKSGFVFDVDLTQVLQSVASGGTEQKTAYDGLVTYTFAIDTGRADWWRGGKFQVQGMTQYGLNVQKASGALLPPNFVAELPDFGKDGSALMELSYTQFVTKEFGFFLGKLPATGGDFNEFAHDYNSQFLYGNLNLNLITSPYPLSTYGVGLVYVPMPGGTVTLSYLGASGSPTQNNISDSFKGGVFAIEGRIPVQIAGLGGHQLLGYIWSDKERLSIKQDPSNIANMLLKEQFPLLNNPGPRLIEIMENYFPGLLNPVQPPNKTTSSWVLYYNFDQFLWSPTGDPKRGIGIFGRFGVSDKVSNPISYSYNFGVGAKGLLASRPQDNWGIGWSRVDINGDFADFLREKLALGLTREDAYEAFYTAQLTRSIGASLNVQYIDQAIKKHLDPSTSRLVATDNAFLVALRLYMRF